MKFNVSQIKKIATDITQLLDAKESVKTKGDGFIEASIWNKFVNGGNTEGNEKVGNGKTGKEQKIGSLTKDIEEQLRKRASAEEQLAQLSESDVKRKKKELYGF